MEQSQNIQMQRSQTPPTNQPMQMPQGAEEPKKSKWWVWLLVVLGIIVLAGLGYYFFLM